ncbi:MAG: UMP kinase [Myxococcota bacterium]
MRYQRVLVKLSGAAMRGGDKTTTFQRHAIDHIVDELLKLRRAGIDVVTVVGGGNIFRGNLHEEWGIEKAEADNMGMLGTVINGVLLRAAIGGSDAGVDVRLMSAVPIPSVAEPYIRLRAIRHLEKGRIVILAGGIGQPYVTTDYPAVQRAIETRCDAVLAAKHGIDGVFDADPKLHSDARRYHTLASDDAIRQNLKAMDQSALLLARDHDLSVHVFNFDLADAPIRICRGEDLGTLVRRDVNSVNYDG